MQYFVKYYIWTTILLGASYSYVFFGPITPLAKLIDNIFLFIFPIVVTAVMILNYPFAKKLSYVRKFGIMTIYFFFLLTLVFILGQWNPAEMQMNKQEKYFGPLGIILIYGVILFSLGTITIVFVQPRGNSK